MIPPAEPSSRIADRHGQSSPVDAPTPRELNRSSVQQSIVPPMTVASATPSAVHRRAAIGRADPRRPSASTGSRIGPTPGGTRSPGRTPASRSRGRTATAFRDRARGHPREEGVGDREREHQPDQLAHRQVGPGEAAARGSGCPVVARPHPLLPPVQRGRGAVRGRGDRRHGLVIRPVSAPARHRHGAGSPGAEPRRPVSGLKTICGSRSSRARTTMAASISAGATITNRSRGCTLPAWRIRRRPLEARSTLRASGRSARAATPAAAAGSARPAAPARSGPPRSATAPIRSERPVPGAAGSSGTSDRNPVLGFIGVTSLASSYRYSPPQSTCRTMTVDVRGPRFLRPGPPGSRGRGRPSAAATCRCGCR